MATNDLQDVNPPDSGMGMGEPSDEGGHGPRSPDDSPREDSLGVDEGGRGSAGSNYDPARWVDLNPPLHCTICEKSQRTMDPPHRTKDCPFPECWVCGNNHAPYHWAATCTETTCKQCRGPHDEYYCPIHPDRPCSSCGKSGHLAPDCRETPTCSECHSPGHLHRDCPMPRCQYCLSRAHQQVDCPHGPGACVVCHGAHALASCPVAMCFNCNRPGHASWDCDQPVMCSNCGGTNHYKNECVDETFTCFACGKGGHIQWDCPAYAPEPQDGGPSQAVPAAPSRPSSHSSALATFAATGSASGSTISALAGSSPAPAESEHPTPNSPRVRTRFGLSERR